MPSIFVDYVLYAVRIANIEELEEMDASELHARRLNGKEVLTLMKGDNFIFPVADGTVKAAGGYRRLRPPTLIRDRPERGEDKKFFEENQREFYDPAPLQDDSTRDDAEAKNDFWSITGEFIYRHHVEPRVKLYMPREESFPTPLKYIDVTRTTHTSLDVLMEKHIEDHWDVEGERELSEAWPGFTRFILLNDKPRDGYTWSRSESNEETNDLKTRHCVARYVEANV